LDTYAAGAKDTRIDEIMSAGDGFARRRARSSDHRHEAAASDPALTGDRRVDGCNRLPVDAPQEENRVVRRRTKDALLWKSTTLVVSPAAARS
jgi:hypothetical protein